MRVLVIVAHPRGDSLGAALAAAFVDGLRDAGVEHRALVLARLAFDPHVRERSLARQALEPDLLDARASIDWADHLVFVYPTWWGTYPAMLKGFLDRMLVPGYAFEHRADGGLDALLKGKTAELITTMDTPRWVYEWIYRAPGHRALGAATLGFCGIRTVRVQAFSPVLGSTVEQRAAWLARHARAAGRLPTVH